MLRHAGLLTLSLAAACGTTTSVVHTNPAPRPTPPRPPSAVEILTTPPAADRPYVEIGFIEVREITELSASDPALLARVRSEGARMGCEAVVIASADRVARGLLLDDTAVTHKGLRGSCLIFRDPAHAIAVAPGDLPRRRSLAALPPVHARDLRGADSRGSPRRRQGGARRLPPRVSPVNQAHTCGARLTVRRAGTTRPASPRTRRTSRRPPPGSASAAGSAARRC